MRKATVVFALLLVSVAWVACQQLPADDLLGPDGALAASFVAPPPPGSCPHGFALVSPVTLGGGADLNEDCAVCRMTNRGGELVEIDNGLGGPPVPGSLCTMKKF